ncbi:hypothetical protein BMS3Bbin03_01045 [bacterium BMS3Bbin03]|nr:hypothetical protein BMS3Bbin03_01045 [bacterium BMS3Bbin03]
MNHIKNIEMYIMHLLINNWAIGAIEKITKWHW